MTTSSSRLQTEAFSAEKMAMASAQARQTVTSSGMFSHKEHSSVAHSNMTISSKNLSTKSTLHTQVCDFVLFYLFQFLEHNVSSMTPYSILFGHKESAFGISSVSANTVYLLPIDIIFFYGIYQEYIIYTVFIK